MVSIFLGGMKIVAYIDGGALKNPGPAAIGLVLEKNGKLWKEYSQPLPYETTNNRAELEAALFALLKLKQLLGKDRLRSAKVTIRSDSTLLVRQLSGQYKVQEPQLQEVFLKIWNQLVDYGGFGRVKFELIPREKNKKADKLVKQALKNSRG